MNLEVQDFQGNVACYGCVPQLRNIDGDVLIHHPYRTEGGTWRNHGRVESLGEVPTVQIENVSGELRLDCSKFNIEVKGVRKGMDVKNMAGNTTAHIDLLHEGSKLKFDSTTGNLSITLSREAAAKFNVGLETEYGCIDYSGWETQQTGPHYSDGHRIYVGTLPWGSPAIDLRVRTMSGKIQISTDTLEKGLP